MGKVDENKKREKKKPSSTPHTNFLPQKVSMLLLFLDIVEKAGVAKGTFYLYFKDKYDIKNKLTAFKTHELFEKAAKALRKADISGLEEQLIFIIDYIIDALASNKALLNFISKNLVMGALRSALLTEERTEPDFYEEFLNLVNEDSYKYECPDVMLFTIVELTGSTAYNSILYNEPLPIEGTQALSVPDSTANNCKPQTIKLHFLKIGDGVFLKKPRPQFFYHHVFSVFTVSHTCPFLKFAFFHCFHCAHY